LPDSRITAIWRAQSAIAALSRPAPLLVTRALPTLTTRRRALRILFLMIGDGKRGLSGKGNGARPWSCSGLGGRLVFVVFVAVVLSQLRFQAGLVGGFGTGFGFRGETGFLGCERGAFDFGLGTVGVEEIL
jgi:hypothetical protein